MGNESSAETTFSSRVRSSYAFSMRRWTDFSGRSDLSEFWLFLAAYIVIYFMSFIIDQLLSLPFGKFTGCRAIVTLVHAVPNLALVARRLHDIDRRGWFMLWPFVGVKALYERGTPGPNRFGPEPRPRDGEAFLDRPRRAVGREEP